MGYRYTANFYLIKKKGTDELEIFHLKSLFILLFNLQKT